MCDGDFFERYRSSRPVLLLLEITLRALFGNTQPRPGLLVYRTLHDCRCEAISLSNVIVE